MEPFEHEGVFWRPGEETVQVAGRLTFDPVEGATLSLLGGFGDIRDQFTQQSKIIRIHGVAGKRYLTLGDCFKTNTEIEMPGTTRQKYAVGFIITDHLFDDDEALTFDKCSVAFDRLSAWVRRSGVKVSLRAPQATQAPDHIDIDFDQIEDEVVKFGDEELRLTSTWALRGDHITETSLYQGTQLEIKYPIARPLADVLSDIKALQDLLTLVTTAPTVATDITLWRDDIVRDVPDIVRNLRPGEARPQGLSYYAGQIAERVRLREPQSPDGLLFTYQDIGGLPTIARWIGVARQFDVAVNSLLSVRYAAGLYVQNRFHNVISAAESFHRLRFSNEVIPKEEFIQLLQELIGAVPETHREWLSQQLQYSNEPSLRRRLKELIKHVREAFEPLCVNSYKWITVVVESRNRLTHHDEERKIDFQSGDLYFLSESVFVLVMLCLFRECDVSDDTLTAVGSTGGIAFLKGKLADIIPRLYAQIATHK
jgi:ApeA N-terminal domain 1/Apea-like HEPN